MGNQPATASAVELAWDATLPPRRRGPEVRWWPAGVDPQPPTVETVDRYLREAGASQWARSRRGWTEAGWWDVPMLPDVRALLRLPKGPQLMAAVQGIAPDGAGCAFPHPRPAELLTGQIPGRPGNPCVCQTIVIAAWAAAAAWAADQADRSVVTALGPLEERVYLDPHRPGLGTIIDPAVEEVAPGLRRSPDSMRLYLAKLRERLLHPESLRRAIADGLLPAWQGDLIMQDLTTVEAPGADLVIDTVMETLRRRHDEGLAGWTFSEIRRQSKKVMAALGDELRRQRSSVQTGRRVGLQRGGDGWSRITADLPSDVAERIYARVTAIAAGLDDDGSDNTDEPRTTDQKRADVFADLLLDSPHQEAADPVATRDEVSIVIPASALLGADDGPAHMSGCGPIPAHVARTLAADRRWRAWITDEAGTVVATSATTYTPSAAVARVIRAREPECRMPGCRRTRVDLDHVIPFPEGPTMPANLASLCRRHHNLKTHHGWHLTDDPPERGSPPTFVWTDPQGTRHRDRLEPRL